MNKSEIAVFEHGKAAEQIFMATMLLLGIHVIDVSSSKDMQKLDVDFFTYGKNNLMVEVKQDSMIHKTGNAYLEIFVLRKRWNGSTKVEEGFVLKTKSDVVAYYDTENHVFYILDTNKLKLFALQQSGTYLKAKNIDGFKKSYHEENGENSVALGVLYNIHKDTANAVIYKLSAVDLMKNFFTANPTANSSLKAKETQRLLETYLNANIEGYNDVWHIGVEAPQIK